MTRTLFTAAAAALLTSTALLASFDDAEARGFGRAGGIHRMNGAAHHANIGRSAHVHVGLGRTAHLGRANITPHVNKAMFSQHNGHQGLKSLNNLNGSHKLAGGSTMKSANLSAGPRSLQNQSQNRTYREVGMDNTQPQTNNNTPSAPDTKSNHHHGNGPNIVTNWKNTFIQNLNPKNIYDLGQSGKFPVGTTFSLCLNAAACAAGAPPAVVEVLTAPLPAVTTSTLEAGINAFTPIDPKNPLSTPVDIGAKNATLNIPKAVQQQLGGNLPPAWGDLK